MNIAVLMASHNRRDSTLECLRLLGLAAATTAVAYTVYLFDDGSTDGTAQAVLARYPNVRLMQGDGTYFWNRAMHAAFAEAMRDGYDAYLWLNDDTMMFTESLDTMLRISAGQHASSGLEAIVVGAIADPHSGEITYGGYKRGSPIWRPFSGERCRPNGNFQPVDLFNGNLVLVPDRAARQLGNLDPAFSHSMGDTDYALRALSAGCPAMLTPTIVGTCRRNSRIGSYQDRQAPMRMRIRSVLSRKGLPWKSWLHFCRRHAGTLWPMHFAWGYLRVIVGRV